MQAYDSVVDIRSRFCEKTDWMLDSFRVGFKEWENEFSMRCHLFTEFFFFFQYGYNFCELIDAYLDYYNEDTFDECDDLVDALCEELSDLNYEDAKGDDSYCCTELDDLIENDLLFDLVFYFFPQ